MPILEQRIINTLKAIRGINAAVTLDELFEYIVSYGHAIGFDTVSIAPLVNPVLLNIDIRNIGRSTWPEDFLEKWIAGNYIIHDPISRRALRSREGFTWKDTYKKTTKKGRRILDEGTNYGLIDGISVPVHLPDLPPGGVGFSGAHCDFSPDERVEIGLVCAHAYSRLMQLSGFSDMVDIRRLTDREADVLHYVAAGKTNWEIARIYSLSEYSVKDHMKNISVKLNAANRAHAVSLGIASGQVII